MNKSVDFLVIGAGPAGICAANILAKSGKSVLVVGKTIGGTYCSCGGILSKSLFRLSEMFEKYRIINSSFIEKEAEEAELDFKRIKKSIDAQANKIKKLFSDSLEDCKAEYIEGIAAFSGVNSVNITPIGENKEILSCSFDKCLIAAGACAPKSSFGAGKRYSDLSSFTNMTSIPDSVCVVGGGVMGLEIASFFHRLGAKVIIAEKNDRILSNIDPYIVKKYEDSLKKRGISVMTEHRVEKIEKIGQKYIALSDGGKIESEEIFICTGRIPAISELCLENSGVSLSDKGIISFGKNLQTDNENIFVAGDVSNMVMNSGWAYYSASVAARNMLGEHIEYNSDILPLYITANPDIAAIGLSEDEAKDIGIDCGVIKYVCGDIYGFSITGGTQTVIKAVYDKNDKTFLGIQAMGQGACDLISIFAPIVHLKIRGDQMPEFIYSNPEFNEFFNEVSEKLS